MSGLEGLAGTPTRAISPAMHNGSSAGIGGGLGDLMGLENDAVQRDALDGFASLDLGGNGKPPAVGEQLKGQGMGKKNDEDLLGLF